MLARVIDVAAWVGSRLPVPIAHGLAVLGGHLEWALRPAKRRRLAVNLGHAVGAPPGARQVRRLVRREMVNEARRSADLLWAIGRPEEFAATVEVLGADHLDAVARRGQGLVLAGLHLGGWEVAASVPRQVVPVATWVVVADNWLAWAIEHVRRRAGLHPIPRSVAGLAAVHVLQRGEAVLVLGDDAWGSTPRRHRVRFCDAEAELPAGVVSLARLTGAPIVSFTVLPTGPRRWQVVVEPPIEPPARHGDGDGERSVHQELADRWTAAIRAHPDQWAASFPIAWVTP